jgi:hypothetical protein
MTIYTITSDVDFTDPTTVPAGCPQLVQHESVTSYILTYASLDPPSAVCVQLPSGSAVGDVFELFGDYANAHGLVIYPASGETIQNIGIGPSCGNLNVGGGSNRIIQKITSTDWRIVSSQF